MHSYIRERRTRKAIDDFEPQQKYKKTERVLIDYCFSKACAVVSGVPQGSVLGSLVFHVYINDIDSVCRGNTTLQLFANDAKLCSNIIVDSDLLTLQQSLDRLASWAKEWQLSININK
jgi:ribonuclease P/MRP protein subunit RPP40